MESGNRITTQDIEDNIVFEGYHSAWEGAEYDRFSTARRDPDYERVIGVALSLTTICTLVLRNGFVVIGTSACASPLTFDSKIGRKLAREKALDEVWKVMGYELRTKLAQSA